MRRTLGWHTLAWRALAVGGRVAVVATSAALTYAVVAARHGRGVARRRLARGVTSTITRLGPTFVKAGQVLSTRRDVLPEALCDELSRLYDAAPPLTEAQSRVAFAEVYGEQLSEIFASIDYTAIASGSVACVYRARLVDGAAVAVKLLRPGIAATMAADLAMIRRGARLVARSAKLRGVPVCQVVDQLCDAVLGQLDFTGERTNLIRLRENLAVLPRVWVPAARPAESRPDCIVMELIPGLRTDTADRCPVVMRRGFAAATLTVVYQMLFVDGFVHCDLHPGNLYFTRSGYVVVLDAGFSARLSERMRRLFADFFLNMAIGRGRRCAEIVIESAAGVRDDADVPAFIEALADLVDRNWGLPAKEFSLIAFSAELFDLQRRYGVAAAPELVFPLLSLLVVEGTVRELDPDVDFQATARPVLTRAKFGVSRASTA